MFKIHYAAHQGKKGIQNLIKKTTPPKIEEPTDLVIEPNEKIVAKQKELVLSSKGTKGE